ncbi:aminoglycoside phosphotransferase family protein [Paenibacillus sp. GYB003]|uniref:aminoglycoside phosphotransferase family protein n=1 Tax=Paenibacillus sp. GYB003 TaxID=2994392 RepID=UPI002F96118D
MIHPVTEINWREKSEAIDLLLDNSGSVTVVPLDSGLEAEVAKIGLQETSFALKVWNKASKPHVESQYKLLKALYDKGLPVSQPLGWGTDREANPVLLTSFDGTPVTKVDRSVLALLAKTLSEIHRFPTEPLDGSILRQYDFIDYFYPNMERHEDLHRLLARLVALGDMRQTKLIHGDFNLGNVLEAEGTYTVIDWTNGQYGDPRYDIAWSIVLVRIYVGPKYGDMYKAAFLSEHPYTPDELELFEAIACLRWILLNRIADLPKGKQTIARVTSILKSNIHLHEKLL